jgi:predicted Fe-Mo cluster-binding NifX family protein
MIKIAIPTDDRSQVSEHTGRARFFAIATIQDDNLTHLEYRNNPPHKHTEIGQHDHKETIALLNDCETLLVRNIGKHLKNELLDNQINIIQTTSKSIGEAIKRYLGASM